jgi:hypothetical protein
MPMLPNADRAVVDERKITEYLLSRTHTYGAAKAAFFEQFGFSAADWRQLRDTLFAHARDNMVDRHYSTAFGEVYEVIGPLATPDGRKPTVLVAWIVRPGEDFPRLVTVVPA